MTAFCILSGCNSNRKYLNRQIFTKKIIAPSVFLFDSVNFEVLHIILKGFFTHVQSDLFFADGNYNRYGGDIDKFQKYETDLQSAIEGIDEPLSDNDLIKNITAVVSKAQSLNKATKKLKKK